MIKRILSLILLTPTALVQVDAVRADISFTGNNDRFDLSDMMSAQNKMFRDTPLVDDEDEDEGVDSDADYRRDLRNEDREVFIDALKRKDSGRALLTRRDDDTFADDDKFAEDDRMNSFEGGTVSDFEDNLKHFAQNNMKPPSRRKFNDDELTEHEMLLRNDVPIAMKVDGYLSPPLQ